MYNQKNYNQMKKKYTIIIVALMLLTGCASYYPQVVDIPLIKEKGDVRIDAGYFLTPNFHGSANLGGHTTISAGLTNMLAIQGYASTDVLFRSYVQGALGLYKGFENKTVMEMYAGYGYGAGLESDDSSNKKRNSYHLAFTQFNIGKTDLGSSHIDYGLGLKGGYLHNNLVEISDNSPFQKKNGYIVEPSVFFRLGGKKVKFSTRVNYLWTKAIRNDYYFPLSVSLGINFHLGRTKSK